MNCYFCNQHHPGGTRFDNQPAVGVCHHCGAGVCAEHAHKDAQPGSPLLCPECAKLAYQGTLWKFVPSSVSEQQYR
jgi:hypothetical protein